MNNYTWNQAPDDVPNMSQGGLPAQLYDVNLPTANVSTTAQRGPDALAYSAYDTETGSHSNHAVKFIPTPTPVAPPAWHTVIKGTFAGLFKRNTTNLATGNITPGATSPTDTAAAQASSGGRMTNLTGGITRANSV